MRFVSERVKHVGTGRFRSGNTTEEIKDYFERVGKYVPAEIIAAYISATNMAPLARRPGTLLLIIFVICVVCTPLYVTRFTKTRKESVVNSLMAVAAFVVWAYATGGGLFKYLDWYDAPTATVVLVLFTLASGAVIPFVNGSPPAPKILNK
jgi:hypothetical protein